MTYKPKLKGTTLPIAFTWDEMLELRTQVKGVRWVKSA